MISRIIKVSLLRRPWLFWILQKMKVNNSALADNPYRPWLFLKIITKTSSNNCLLSEARITYQLLHVSQGHEYGSTTYSDASFITYCRLFWCFWFCWWTLFLSSFWTCGWRRWPILSFAFLFYITLIPKVSKPVNQLQKLPRPDKGVKKTQKKTVGDGTDGFVWNSCHKTKCVIHLSSRHQEYLVPVSCNYI